MKDVCISHTGLLEPIFLGKFHPYLTAERLNKFPIFLPLRTAVLYSWTPG
jgi:hypothetical protein